VGGLGLTITEADRVIIFDPAWNTLDDQSADRVYRPGQKKDVVIYRLISCGAIEEKIYRKQVFKASLMKVVVEQQNKKTGVGRNRSYDRYFTEQELKDLFMLGNTNRSETQHQLTLLHDPAREQSVSFPVFLFSYYMTLTRFSRKHISTLLQRHLDYLTRECPTTQLVVAGFSHHDLLFSKEDQSTSNSATMTELPKAFDSGLCCNVMQTTRTTFCLSFTDISYLMFIAEYKLEEEDREEGRQA